ncbi:hypothetical protein ANCCEY_14095 [Ancylostoma ceylanicum]|uniref:Major facilitator superfamily (MFS) profile domain-containing protein n=1 Tax=Ancylostoma ceylanicum TaxID=53326 RepID=A0A0D6LGQ5_9BILA|nr:hypothetical protein ANCCEY_14095 [Ancylostoma ceylanicum]
MTNPSFNINKKVTIDKENGDTPRNRRKELSLEIAVDLNCITSYEQQEHISLLKLDKTTSVDFLGWVVAACSLGCSLANPLFGWWNQKTMSIKHPVIVGMLMAAAGQTFYGLLPLFSSQQKWIMMGSRLVTGFGAGTLSVLRAYAATASLPRDRLRAVSFGTAGMVLGLSVGPAIQAVFTPVGETGFMIGPVIFNMYTLPAFFMTLFEETYAGILMEEDSSGDVSYEKKQFTVVPKYDLIPALICIYLWIVTCMVAINIEV